MKYSLSRTIILSFAILAFALILVSKLFLVQIVHSGSYLDRADRQYATPSANIFERGTIYLTRRDGELISAATQTSGFKIAIAPGKIAPPEQTFEKLSRITVLEENDFLEKAEKRSRCRLRAQNSRRLGFQRKVALLPRRKFGIPPLGLCRISGR